MGSSDRKRQYRNFFPAQGPNYGELTTLWVPFQKQSVDKKLDLNLLLGISPANRLVIPFAKLSGLAPLESSSIDKTYLNTYNLLRLVRDVAFSARSLAADLPKFGFGVHSVAG